MATAYLKKNVRPGKPHIICVEADTLENLNDEMSIYTADGWETATSADFSNQSVFFSNRGSVAAPYIGGAQKTTKASGTFTRAAVDGSGTSAVTGLGFRPSIIHIVAADDAFLGNTSIGWTDGVTSVSTSNLSANLAKCIDIASVGNGYTAAVAMDSDGFTINWTKAGQGLNITAKYLAIK